MSNGQGPATEGAAHKLIISDMYQVQLPMVRTSENLRKSELIQENYLFLKTNNPGQFQQNT